MDWSTPLGKTRVIRKVTDPVWYPPASIRKEHNLATQQDGTEQSLASPQNFNPSALRSEIRDIIAMLEA